MGKTEPRACGCKLCTYTKEVFASSYYIYYTVSLSPIKVNFTPTAFNIDLDPVKHPKHFLKFKQSLRYLYFDLLLLRQSNYLIKLRDLNSTRTRAVRPFYDDDDSSVNSGLSDACIEELQEDEVNSNPTPSPQPSSPFPSLCESEGIFVSTDPIVTDTDTTITVEHSEQEHIEDDLIELFAIEDFLPPIVNPSVAVGPFQMEPPDITAQILSEEGMPFFEPLI